MAYGNKRDYTPIEVWHDTGNGGDGKVLTTTWSTTVTEARAEYARRLGVKLTAIGGRRKLKR